MRPAECLQGVDLPGNWHVVSILTKPNTSTGGKFSVGYKAVNDKGQTAYLKALDFSSAFQSPDPARALQQLTTAFNFERDLLLKCKGRRFKRIVTPLADGSVNINGSYGPLNNVMYIIFELADGDIRSQIAQWHSFDLAWALRSLHHSAIGLQQLHTLGIAHQDIKPSNILVFPIEGSKVADLGRASSIHCESEVDSFPIPGDAGYAPPEQWYSWKISNDFSPRYLYDFYLLGSLVFFFFLGCSATQAIETNLLKAHNKQFDQTDFLHDLPYIQSAFIESLEALKTSASKLAGNSADEIVMIVKQLCEPDPRRRGDPKVLRSRRPQHDLQSYISRFDRIAFLAEKRMTRQ